MKRNQRFGANPLNGARDEAEVAGGQGIRVRQEIAVLLLQLHGGLSLKGGHCGAPGGGV